ncbi:L-histidine N(alpha)-methyltransferase [Aquisalimonas sp.]|uniref:L-histidine N(alpha)-methyltransferase n=1 Tax=Aquisalimonas sp. TaxID=1872621 RepID=UPI0025C53BA3|nr:L-histidine N(alpha)-methyltransferase [Aquisalimonas sp.]
MTTADDDLPAASRQMTSSFLTDVLTGLSAPLKQVPPKYFYDEAGSHLFDRICELPEYYVTRTELGILQDSAADMAQALGPGVLLIEPGSGNSAKISLLLAQLQDPVGYVPVEISGEHMLASLEAVRAQFPDLEILPVCDDFTAPFTVPTSSRAPSRRVVFFPGSTLGNFPPHDAVELLRSFHEVAGPDGALLLGADLRKAPEIVLPAYDDSAGVTAAFNRNLLVRMQRELGADLDADAFRHQAVWNDAESRIEMHLVSTAAQTIRVGGQCFEFAAEEPIVTEYSYKYTRERLAGLATEAGFRVAQVWTDAREWFSVQLLTRN